MICCSYALCVYSGVVCVCLLDLFCVCFRVDSCVVCATIERAFEFEFATRW